MELSASSSSGIDSTHSYLIDYSRLIKHIQMIGERAPPVRTAEENRFLRRSVDGTGAEGTCNPAETVHRLCLPSSTPEGLAQWVSRDSSDDLFWASLRSEVDRLNAFVLTQEQECHEALEHAAHHSVTEESSFLLGNAGPCLLPDRQPLASSMSQQLLPRGGLGSALFVRQLWIHHPTMCHRLVNSQWIERARVADTADQSILSLMDRFIKLCGRLDNLRKCIVSNYSLLIRLVREYDRSTQQHTEEIFLSLLKRQPFVRHRLVLLLARAATIIDGEASREWLEAKDYVCLVCGQIPIKPVLLSCQHRMCFPCLFEGTTAGHSCPVCSAQVSVDRLEDCVESMLTRFVSVYLQDRKRSSADDAPLLVCSPSDISPIQQQRTLSSSSFSTSHWPFSLPFSPSPTDLSQYSPFRFHSPSPADFHPPLPSPTPLFLSSDVPSPADSHPPLPSPTPLCLSSDVGAASHDYGLSSQTRGLRSANSSWSCHRCKSSKEESMLMLCTMEAVQADGRRPKRCHKKYCQLCLRNIPQREGTQWWTPSEPTSWKCPACLGLCPCASCQRRYTFELLSSKTSEQGASKRRRVQDLHTADIPIDRDDHHSVSDSQGDASSFREAHSALSANLLTAMELFRSKEGASTS